MALSFNRTIEPKVKNWVNFYYQFKNTMKANDKSEEESLHYLRHAIHADLQTDLENEKV